MARELKGIVATCIALLVHSTGGLAETFSKNESLDLKFSWKGVNRLSLNSYSDPNVTSDCKKYSICNNVDNYPTDLAVWALEKIRTKLNMVKYMVEKISNEEQEQIVQLCPSQEKILYPTAALSKDGGWYFILNLPGNNFQGYHVNKCNNTSSCLGVTKPSECQQVYTDRSMFYLDLKEQFVSTKTFKVPSCCSCAVDF